MNIVNFFILPELLPQPTYAQAQSNIQHAFVHIAGLTLHYQ